jgi:hypothetical protein
MSENCNIPDIGALALDWARLIANLRSVIPIYKNWLTLSNDIINFGRSILFNLTIQNINDPEMTFG